MVLRLLGRAVAEVRAAALLLWGFGLWWGFWLCAVAVASPVHGQAPIPPVPPAPSTPPPVGPLVTQEGAPLQRLGYSLSVEGVDPIAAGSAEVSLWMGYGNVFQRDSVASHFLAADFERLITAVGVRWGLTDDLDVAGRLTFETTGGGWMDPFVEGFHRALGLRDDVRESLPQNAYAQELRREDGTLIAAVPRRDFTLEELRLSARWRALRGADDGWAVGTRVELRVPTAPNLRGDESTEAAVSLLARTRFWRSHLHLLAGVATVSGAPDSEFLRGAQTFGSLSLEIPFGASWSGIVQGGVSSARLSGFEGQQVDGLHTHLVAGFRGRAGRWGWQVAFQEDLPVLGSSADFSLQAGVSRSW